MHENPAKVQNAWKLTKLFFIRGNKKCQKQCYREEHVSKTNLILDNLKLLTQ